MALLYLLSKTESDIFVVHINYGLRGEDSELDQELVEGMCTEWNIECCSVRVESPNKTGTNFQNWAREERYRIFRDIKTEQSADYIVTAHHQDDQLETIFQKLLRGSGIGAWDAMQVVERDIFRPLLGVNKEEIHTYCEENTVPFREDASNLENKYARNLLRNQVFEEFEYLFPGWRKNILELEERGKSYQAAIDVVFKKTFNGTGINLKSYNNLEDSLKADVLRKYLFHENQDIQLSRGQLIELKKIGEVQTGTSIKIDEYGQLFKEREQITFKPNQSDERVQISIREEEVNNMLETKGLRFHFSVEPKTVGLNLDANSLNWPLVLRKWKDGDTISPLGMTGSQKVADHLTNRKISSSQKESSLVLQGADSFIYAVIFPEPVQNGEIGTISEKVKYNSHTSSYLIIQQAE